MTVVCQLAQAILLLVLLGCLARLLHAAAQAHLVCEEVWVGRLPWTPEHQEGLR